MDDVLVREKAMPFGGHNADAPACLNSATRINSSKEQPLRSQKRRGYDRFGKRILDLLLICAGAPIVLPVVLFCAVALWIESGLPFYRQARLGRDGRVFTIWKLRTMVRDAETLLAFHLDNDPKLKAEWDATQKLKNDPRITRMGRVLRATSLDELPQLWNVVKGDMSLVGPRPMLPDQLEMYGDPDAYFAMRPGLTGQWQVSARNESGFEARQHMDRDYHMRLSLRADADILRRTVGVVLRGTGY